MSIMCDQVVLYHSPTAFLSQKVVFALYEKKIPYVSRVVNLASKENEEPWFLKMNPKGRVPVLRHGDRFITVATTIIDYLDRNFNGNKMFPIFSSDEGKLAEKYHILFTNISVEMMTYRLRMEDDKFQCLGDTTCSSAQMDCGTVEIRPRPPSCGAQIVEVRQQGKDQQSSTGGTPDHTIEDLINLLKNAFGQVENQLRTYVKAGQPDNWLCGAGFNIADIVLTLILHRTRLAGWSSCTWEDGCHPNIERYFCVVRMRDSFRCVFDLSRPPTKPAVCCSKAGTVMCCCRTQTGGLACSLTPACDPCEDPCLPQICASAGGRNSFVVALPCSPRTSVRGCLDSPIIANTSISTGLRCIPCGNHDVVEEDPSECIPICPPLCTPVCPPPCGIPCCPLPCSKCAIVCRCVGECRCPPVACKCPPECGDRCVEFKTQDGTKVRCRPGPNPIMYQVCDENGCSEVVFRGADDRDYTVPILMGCTVVGFSSVAAYFIYKALTVEDFDYESDYCY